MQTGLTMPEQNTHGRLIRLRMKPVAVDIRRQVVEAVGSIIRGFSAVVSNPPCQADRQRPRPSQVLDNLLDAQVNAILAGVSAEVPLTLDATVPSVVLRIHTDLDKDSTSQVRLQLSDTALLLRNSEATGMAMTVKMATLAVGLDANMHVAPAVHLGHVDPRYDGAQTPLMRYENRGVSANIVKASNQTVVRIDSAATDARLVSTTLEIAQQTIARWTDTITRIDVGSPPDDAAQLICGIIHPDVTEMEQYLESRPIFASVKSSPLHKEDERNIRLNHGWRILSQLRMLYPAMQARSKRLLASKRMLDKEELCDRLGRLDWFEESAYALTLNQPFVQQIVTSLDQGEPIHTASSGSTSVIVASDILSLRHHDRLLGGISLGVSSIVVTGLSGGVVMEAMGGGQNVQRQHRYFGAIKSVGVDIRDSLLGLARNAPISTTKRGKPTVPQPEQQAHLGPQILCDVHIGSFGVDITAGGLRMTTIIDRLHTMAWHRPHLSAESSSLIVTYDKTSFNLLALGGNTGRPDYPVIEFATSSFRTVVTSTKQLDSPKRHLRVLVGLQNLTFETKAQLRSFLVYVHEWKDEHQA
jgi:hypothetical protein